MNKPIVLISVIALIIAAIVVLQEPAPKTEVERVTPAQKKSGIPAPELAGISGYINTDKITLKELVGKKVVLVDIWTYSCINCQRTLPYITKWYEKYNDKGLEIIGVHSPEFDFEKKRENVERAVKKFGITYPVVLDNDHGTWNAYQNRYWPAKYLIDINGYVVWKHFGEGGYDEAEQKIQELLQERAERLGMKETMPEEMAEVKAETPEFGRIRTPEIYLGYAFTRGNFGNKENLPARQTVNYTLPKTFAANQVYLEGSWFVDKDHVKLVSKTGKIVLKYDAKNVNIVAAADPGSNVTVTRDDKPVGSWCSVSPEKKCVSTIREEDLYTIISSEEYGEHTLVMTVENQGFRLYTFTFG